jgi:hypothetical protein
MTVIEYWEAHVTRNPTFVKEDNEIKLKVRMLKRLMEEAFNRGVDHQKQQAKSIGNLNDLDDLFGSMFGNKK